MKKDSLWIVITTVLSVIISIFSFTLALAYLQIPKEIPTPQEIEIPTEELKKPPRVKQQIQEIKKEKVKSIEMQIPKKEKEVKKEVLPYYARLVKEKAWKGTGTSKIAIILDDAGYSINGFVKQLLQIQSPLTISVLPGVKYSKEIANMAYEKGCEIMLHMPMEYCGNSKMTDEDKLCKAGHNMKPYKYAILTGMSKEQIEENLEEALNSIPHVVGMNNHMGSKATADEVLMSYVLDKVKTKNCYFIDSLTSSCSVAWKLARQKSIRTNKRDVFLDNVGDVDYVKERINELIYRAKRNGYAIGIGHATKETTTKALVEMIPKLKEYNIEIVPASQLVH